MKKQREILLFFFAAVGEKKEKIWFVAPSSFVEKVFKIEKPPSTCSSERNM